MSTACGTSWHATDTARRTVLAASPIARRKQCALLHGFARVAQHCIAMHCATLQCATPFCKNMYAHSSHCFCTCSPLRSALLVVLGWVDWCAFGCGGLSCECVKFCDFSIGMCLPLLDGQKTQRAPPLHLITMQYSEPPLVTISHTCALCATPSHVTTSQPTVALLWFFKDC